MTRKTRGEREWERRQKEAEFYARFSGGPVAFTRPGQPVAPAAPKPSAPGPQHVKPAQTAAAAPWSQQEHQPNTGWPDASYGDSHKGGDGFFSAEVHRYQPSRVITPLGAFRLLPLPPP